MYKRQDPIDADVLELATYYNNAPRTSVRDRIVFSRPATSSYVPAKVFINSVSYAMEATPSLANSYRSTANSLGHLMAPSRRYSVNFENASGDLLYPDATVTAGTTLSYNARDTRWVIDEAGKSNAEILAIANTAITANNVANGVKPQRFLTLTQYNAITVKDPDTLYFIYS